MPPVPPSLDEQTQGAIENLSRRAKDLAEFQIPRLRSCTGPLAVQQRLAGELREDLDTFAKHIEILDVAIDDQKREVNRRELRRIVEDFQKTLVALRKDTRAAILASKRAIDSAVASGRDELLRGSNISEKQPEGLSAGDDALMRASNDVTEALRRTMVLMQGELEKSVLSNQMLEDSSATLRSTSAQHDVLTLVMGTSKQLITALERADWLDRMLVAAGLSFFVLVVLFIIKQRIVDRGIRIAFWWTKFLPDSSGVEILDKMEAGLSSPISSIAATVTSSLTAAISSVSLAVTLSSKVVSQTSAIPQDYSSVLSDFTDSVSMPSSTIATSIYSPTTIVASTPTLNSDYSDTTILRDLSSSNDGEGIDGDQPSHTSQPVAASEGSLPEVPFLPMTSQPIAESEKSSPDASPVPIVPETFASLSPAPQHIHEEL